MSRPALSLQDLVRHAVVEVRCRWLEEHKDGGPPEEQSELENLLADVLDAVEQDGFFRLCFGSLDDLLLLKAFQATCELAERIDSFLALRFDGMGAALARACREDLEVLTVLADWHADEGRPRAAAEARHLLALVHSLPRVPPASARRPPEWSDRDPDPDDLDYTDTEWE
jgi:hypothetical protein